MRHMDHEPASKQCEDNAVLAQDATAIVFATYDYPQMGGYRGRAVVSAGAVGDCFDAAIWHDGEFPISEADERSPARLHHCCPLQFVHLGLTVLEKQAGLGASETNPHNVPGLIADLRGQIERAQALLTKLEAM